MNFMLLRAESANEHGRDAIALTDRVTAYRAPRSLIDRKNLHTWHSTFFIGLVLLVIMFTVLAPESIKWFAIPIACAGILILGMPHGATDVLLAKALWGNLPLYYWMPAFLLGYIGLALGVAFLWWWIPVIALAGFLLVSAYHFGSEDLEGAPDGFGKRSPVERGFYLASRGVLPIATPMAFHPDAVVSIFDRLVGSPLGPAFLWGIEKLAIWLVMAAVVVQLGLALRQAASDEQRPMVTWLEPLAVVLLFAVSPPLLAFTLYFCGLHAIRHILSLRDDCLIRTSSPRVTSAALQVAPFALASIVGAAWLILYFSVDSLLNDAALRVTFISLAALLVPHIVLGYVYSVYGSRSKNSAEESLRPKYANEVGKILN